MILFLNVDDVLKNEIEQITKDKSKDITSVFIDWVPTKNLKKAATLLSQTEIVEKYINKIPIVIFDSHCSITNEEYCWLKKGKITFFEPAILHRTGFQYLPFSTKVKKTVADIDINTNRRTIHLGYIGPLNDKLTSFERYFVDTKERHLDLKVSYYSKSISVNKEEEYRNININNNHIQFSDIEFTVIIGSQNDYKRGILDKFFFTAIENNCVPFLPIENRYYQSFSYTIRQPNWYDIYQSLYNNLYIGMLNDLYNDICKCYPEMDIKYTAETIKHYLEEK